MYVKVIVFAVEDAATFEREALIVPEPLAAFCVTVGWRCDVGQRPPAVPFCCVVQVTAPVVAEAVAPGPPEAVDP